MDNHITAGLLRDYALLQYPTITHDEAGTPVKSWTDSEYVWIHIRPQSGYERFITNVESAFQTYTVYMRRPLFLPAPSWRMKIITRGNITVEFTSITELTLGFLRCDAVEVVE